MRSVIFRTFYWYVVAVFFHDERLAGRNMYPDSFFTKAILDLDCLRKPCCCSCCWPWSFEREVSLYPPIMSPPRRERCTAITVGVFIAPAWLLWSWLYMKGPYISKSLVQLQFSSIQLFSAFFPLHHGRPSRKS
jgi:hypothetical protein